MDLQKFTLNPIAYFSMEIAVENQIPTYSGGLGVLAGDTIRAAADMGLAFVGVTLLYRKGYFFQRLDETGGQHEDPVAWSVDDVLEPLDATCKVEIEGREVTVRVWRRVVHGVTGSTVPVLFLDTDVPGNEPFDRTLTDRLYGGDLRYRLCQEVILGIGGVRILHALGIPSAARYHMNEGHSALLALELFSEELRVSPGSPKEALERAKRRCVFTTHTPVPAGHDQFPVDLARSVLGPEPIATLAAMGCCEEVLNMTFVALQLSHYVNGVTRRHGEVSRSMFPGYPISSITNGVHSATWTSPEFQAVYDRYIPDWRTDNYSLRSALTIPHAAIAEAHRGAKERLLHEANERANAGFDMDVLTLGFARRVAAYKRPALLLHEPDTLRRIARERGRLQILFAGKAHPQDREGRGLIQKIIGLQAERTDEVRVAYIPNYDMELGALFTAGVDLWINTPKPPYEASGTSGMKAAHNGVPSLSVLDGWWFEGHMEGVTGWSIGDPDPMTAIERSDEDDARELYRTLGETIVPLYYRNRTGWTEVMRQTIAVNASFFNTQRMLHQYSLLAYRDPPSANEGPPRS